MNDLIECGLNIKNPKNLSMQEMTGKVKSYIGHRIFVKVDPDQIIPEDADRKDIRLVRNSESNFFATHFNALTQTRSTCRWKKCQNI